MHYSKLDYFREKDAPRDLIIPQNITWVKIGSFTIDSISTLRIPNTTTLDFGWINFEDVRELVIEDGDTPFYYTPLMSSEGAFRYYPGTREPLIEKIYVGRSKKGTGDMIIGFSNMTVNNLIIGPKVTEFVEPNKYIIKAIYSLSENPEQVTIGFSSSFFANGSTHNTYAETPLYVPVGTKDRYMAAEGWKEFQTIEEKANMPTGINSTSTFKSDKVSCYNLQGLQLKSAPTKGINIIRQSDGTTRKVVVK